MKRCAERKALLELLVVLRRMQRCSGCIDLANAADTCHRHEIKAAVAQAERALSDSEKAPN